MAPAKLTGFLRAAIIVSTVLPTACLSQPQTMGRAHPVGRPPTLLHRIADSETPGGPDGFADLAERVEPAVIAVTTKLTTRQAPALPDQQFEFGPPDPKKAPDEDGPAQDGSHTPGDPRTSDVVATGSGFFISADGYAVTSSNLVQGIDSVQIRTHDSRAFAARVVASDPPSDLALIKVDGRTDFAFVGIADRPPRVGDWVLSAGNPFGIGATVTAGIVSAREREIEAAPSDGLLQIDAATNSGDTGGPIFNTSGEVIGVTSMIFSPSGGSAGVAFAIPADTVQTVIPQLRDKGSVRRGSLAAAVQSVTPEIADSLGADSLHGAIVTSVQADGPAARAGLKSGDVITSAAGEPIKSAGELSKRIHATAPGSSIQLATVRQGKQSSLSVTLGELPQQSSPSMAAPR